MKALIQFVIILGIFYVAHSFYSCSTEHTENTENIKQEQNVEIETKSAIDTFRNNLATTQTLGRAIELIKPMMSDHADNDVSAGAAVLAGWMLQRPPPFLWAQLEELSDNKRVEIEKDVAPFRGKKLCTRGNIIQIFTDRTIVKPIYYGVLGAGWSGVVRFVAVGSTKNIVENSNVRFCGIVIGIHSYNTSIGGSISGAEVVGIFDIPENTNG